MRPVRGWMSAGSASAYVPFSLASWRYSRIFPGKRVPERQLLQHVHVGRVAGLRALDRRQLQLLEEHDRELLRRVRVDRLAGELVDLPQERVELRVELLRELARAARDRPGSRPAPCRPGRGRAAPRASRRGSASPCSREQRRPGPRRAATRPRPARPVHAATCAGSASPTGAPARSVSSAPGTAGAPGLGAQLVERIAAPARVEEIRRDRRVVDAAGARAATPAPRAQATRAFVSCPTSATPAGSSGQPTW